MHSEITLCEERTTFKGEKGVSFIVQYIDKLLWEEDRRKEGSHIKLMIDRSIDGWIDI